METITEFYKNILGLNYKNIWGSNYNNNFSLEQSLDKPLKSIKCYITFDDVNPDNYRPEFDNPDYSFVDPKDASNKKYMMLNIQVEHDIGNKFISYFYNHFGHNFKLNRFEKPVKFTLKNNLPKKMEKEEFILLFSTVTVYMQKFLDSIYTQHTITPKEMTQYIKRLN